MCFYRQTVATISLKSLLLSRKTKQNFYANLADILNHNMKIKIILKKHKKVGAEFHFIEVYQQL